MSLDLLEPKGPKTPKKNPVDSSAQGLETDSSLRPPTAQPRTTRASRACRPKATHPRYSRHPSPHRRPPPRDVRCSTSRPDPRSGPPEGRPNLRSKTATPMLRRTPARRPQNPPHLESEDRRRVEPSKDLYDTASFKEPKAPASLTRSLSPRRAGRSIGGDPPAPPATPRRTAPPSKRPSSRLDRRSSKRHDIRTAAPKSHRSSFDPLLGPPTRECRELSPPR